MTVPPNINRLSENSLGGALTSFTMQITFTVTQLEAISDLVGFEVENAYVQEDDLRLYGIDAAGNSRYAEGSVDIDFIDRALYVEVCQIDDDDVSLNTTIKFK